MPGGFLNRRWQRREEKKVRKKIDGNGEERVAGAAADGVQNQQEKEMKADEVQEQED